MKQTISANLMDRPGALNRVVSLIRRRGLNVESLNVVRTDVTDISRLTMVLEMEADGVNTLVKQLERLIDVLDVTLDNADEPRSASESGSRFSRAQADGVVG